MRKKIRLIIFILLFILLFIFLNILVSPKYAIEYKEGNMISEYYKEEKNHEVIFIGDCEVYTNFSPLKIYEESGITSYVRGSSQQMIWQSYYILKETLKYEIPKVVVFNVNSMRYEEQVKEPYNRMTIDKMRWSKEKIEIINASKIKNELFLSYVFPILRYHSRITKLTSEDFNYLFKSSNNTYNGFLINNKVKPVTSLPTNKVLANYNFSDKNYEYLDKIYDLCKKNNIDLLLIKAPSLYPYWYKEYDEQIEKFAKKNNTNYINLLNYTDEIGIDYQNDTYDGGLHLNLNGATKLSLFFAKYLNNNYDFNDYREDINVNKIYINKIKKYNKTIGDM